jgi:8-oxo-dGTP pyrophosphatase MutT (NUDIX family)
VAQGVDEEVLEDWRSIELETGDWLVIGDVLNNRTLCFLLRGNPPEVLLGLKKVGFGAGKYAGFGGRVETGETVETAAIRELEEETSIKVSRDELRRVAHLTFLFAAKPEWSQTVHVFMAKTWSGSPIESDEMKPVWCRNEEIPFEQMWDDASYWLPQVLDGKRIRARFIYRDDNQTVGDSEVIDWDEEREEKTILQSSNSLSQSL